MDFFKNVPTHMDYDGQRRAEKYSRFIILVFGGVGLVWGYILQQFSQTVYILGAGFALASALTIPPWPMFRHKPLSWQKPRPESDPVDANFASSPASSTRSKKKK